MINFTNLSCLAIVPARGGSKRIPKKNIKIFNGLPIIQYPIKAAIASSLFAEIMVSTDDDSIAEVAQKSGAKIPFRRSIKNSNDYSTVSDVIIEVINEYEKRGKRYDYFCCLLPTAVFITAEAILKAFEILIENNFDSVFPIVKYSFPIQRALKIKDDKIGIVSPETYRMRSQDLEPMYHDSGQFYLMKTDIFKNEKHILTNNTGVLEVSESLVQDIDTEEDWKLAELKYSLFEKQFI